MRRRVHRGLGTIAVAAVALCLPAAAPGSTSSPLRPVIVVVASQSMAPSARPVRSGERALRSAAGRSQTGLRALLRDEAARGQAADVRPLWIVNEISLRASDALIRQLEQRSDVAAVTPDIPLDIALATTPTGGATPAPNLEAIGVPQLWARGVTGAGAVVASLDTGVDMTDPDLAAAYRGGSGGWFDPYGQQPVPADRSGHGTWTLGVMVGGADTGTALGVAPGARWIAARVFDDGGRATVSGIHAAFQWAIDPDRNPATDDRPDVVDAPWAFDAPGCDTTFLPDIQALRAVGVLTVFAAGNAGPLDQSDRSPANNPGAISAGATDAAGAVAPFSSRGPSSCTGAPYPTLTAPGVSIPTTDRFGLDTTETGTSMSAPHVAGALALLHQAFPGLTADEQESALAEARAGRLDVLASYERLAAGQAELLFADDFESGRLSRWDGRHGSGLLVSTAAALGGAWGLAVRGAEGGSAVVDRHVSGRTTVRVGVDVSAGSADTTGRGDDVIAGFGARGQRLFALQLRTSRGSARVRLLVRTGPAMTASPAQTLPPGHHRVELMWSADDSAAELRLDGVPVGLVAGVARRVVDRLELGWRFGGQTRSGQLAFDDYRSTA